MRRRLALVYAMRVAGRTLSREGLNVGLGCFSPHVLAVSGGDGAAGHLTIDAYVALSSSAIFPSANPLLSDCVGGAHSPTLLGTSSRIPPDGCRSSSWRTGVFFSLSSLWRVRYRMADPPPRKFTIPEFAARDQASPPRL
ncbi:hypothetical protein LXA43DRAFT_556066 [Ganoderma leucocontextum]|nr:hypothetical protein LXA43DRAFT_556066 [Ganoderma leucocontextum]